MIKPEQVPEAAWRATGLPEIAGRAVIAAALNAWPGMEIEIVNNGSEQIVLPLTTQEPGDE